jgi:hypothetical protein
MDQRGEVFALSPEFGFFSGMRRGCIERKRATHMGDPFALYGGGNDNHIAI